MARRKEKGRELDARPSEISQLYFTVSMTVVDAVCMPVLVVVLPVTTRE